MKAILRLLYAVATVLLGLLQCGEKLNFDTLRINLLNLLSDEIE